MSAGLGGDPRPSLAEFTRLAREYSVVPVWRELLGDLETPVSAFHKLGGGEGSVLLESVEHGERWGRFSFIGTDPFATFVARDGRAAWTGEPPDGLPEGPPLVVLRAALERLRSPAVPELGPLHAGAVGYLGYDLAREPGRAVARAADDLGLPDALLVLPRSVVVFDHLAQRLALVSNVLTGPALDAEKAYLDAGRRVAALAERLALPSPSRPLPLRAAPAERPPAGARGDPEPGRYRRMVEAARERVRAGDVLQVAPSRRWSLRTGAEPFDVYRLLRVRSPSQYMYFLRLPGVTLAGSSPEALVSVQGRAATMLPIAGARPRGADAAADLAFEEELRGDGAERAEHVMLVDLAQADLARVCRPGTVRVQDLMRVERYSHVMHLVSEVAGELADGVAPLDVVTASLPAGSVSGSPKARAMEIIDQLEPRRRGPYGGAVGYFDFSGNLDTCVAIRTCVFVGDTVYCQAGAGVAAESPPGSEERGTEAEAAALLAAVTAAEPLRVEPAVEPRADPHERR